MAREMERAGWDGSQHKHVRDIQANPLRRQKGQREERMDGLGEKGDFEGVRIFTGAQEDVVSACIT
jgi:hypothetical protein